MKVLLSHNYYQYRGGEDESFDAEAELLERHGHDVVRFVRSNDAIKNNIPLSVAGRTLWNRGVARELEDVLRAEQPDVVHGTNLFPLISPSVYRVIKRMGVPVVQALRNYRPFCVTGTFQREGRQCTDCLDKPLAWRGVARGCYRSSRMGSAVVAGWQTFQHHQAVRRGRVDLFFTPSAYTRDRYIEGGYDPQRIVVKPNFADRPTDYHPEAPRPGYVLYVGRLSSEKGVDVLCRAWDTLAAEGIELKVAGDGPQRSAVEAAAAQGKLTWVGQKPRAEVEQLMAKASVLVVPSVFPETFGRIVIESYAYGTPVIATSIGALPELIDEPQTGLLCRPGDADDLIDKVRTLWHDPIRMRTMGHAARALFEQRYTPERNYELLIELYEKTIALAG